MSQSRVRGVGERKARVDILPLIDVMFLLVCFFIYITMMMVMQKGIFVNLAPATSGESIEEGKKMITLSINQAGEFFIDKEPIQGKELEMKLNELKEEDSILTINTDRSVEYGEVIHVLDRVRKIGLTEVIFSVEPES